MLPALVIAGCKDSTTGTSGSSGASGSAGASGSSGAAVPGTISGRITNGRGEPVKGVEVFMNATTFGGGVTQVANPSTGDDGRFKAKLPEGIYGVTAVHTVMFHGRRYKLDMHPLDGIDGSLKHDSRDGYVKDFVWKISDERPGQNYTPGQPHHHGGVIDLQDEAGFHYANGNYQNKGTELTVGSTVTITMTPSGPMIDGSQGSVVTRQFELKRAFWRSPEHDLLDIPLGKYSVSAKVTEPGGAIRDLRVSTSPGNDSTILPTPAAATSELEFMPNQVISFATGTWLTRLFLMN